MGIHIEKTVDTKRHSYKAIKTVLFVIIGIVAIGVTSICVRAHCIDKIGLTINGVHLNWHEVADYKSIVEPTLVPNVFDEHNDILTEGFICHLEDHEFTKNDIGKTFDLKYTYDFDKTILTNSLNTINKSATKSQDAYIDVDKLEIIPEVYGTEIDVPLIINAIDGNSIIKVSDYYIDPTITSDVLEKCVEEYNDWRRWGISYADYDVILVANEGAISIDEKGNITIESTQFINDFVDELCLACDTKGKEYEFVTNSGDTIIVPAGGTLGSKVDSEKEIKELVSLFETNEVVIDKDINYLDHREIEDKYIEVSIDKQHVWYYENGEVVWESDCVSGCSSRKNDTTKGAWYLDIVMNGKTLYPDGPSKPGTWVDKWMRFTPTGIGLHDASWRSRFGGTIYKTNGSHGCINLPKNKAYELFEYTYVGLPVIVY